MLTHIIGAIIGMIAGVVFCIGVFTWWVTRKDWY